MEKPATPRVKRPPDPLAPVAAVCATGPSGTRLRAGGSSLLGSVGIHILLVAAAWAVTVISPSESRRDHEEAAGDDGGFEMAVMPLSATGRLEAPITPTVLSPPHPASLLEQEPATRLSCRNALAGYPLPPATPMAKEPEDHGAVAGRDEENGSPARHAACPTGMVRKGAGRGRAAGIPSAAPKLLHAPPPPYPSWAKAAKIAGRVGVLIRVQADGSPASACVYHSCGNRLLDQAAVDAAKSWKFSATPGLAGKTAIPVVVNVTFSL